jgi:hypothetical protein
MIPSGFEPENAPAHDPRPLAVEPPRATLLSGTRRQRAAEKLLNRGIPN